jgi:hypothetical protein
VVQAQARRGALLEPPRRVLRLLRCSVLVVAPATVRLEVLDPLLPAEFLAQSLREFRSSPAGPVVAELPQQTSPEQAQALQIQALTRGLVWRPVAPADKLPASTA